MTRVSVAVVNSSEDTVEMLRACLVARGFENVSAAHVPDIKRGELDIVEFLRAHDPQVILWDVSLPYDENWQVLQEVLRLEAMRGRQVVVTTTNKRALEDLVGPTPAFEIHGKPYDLEEIMAAVERAAAACAGPPRPVDRRDDSA